MSCHSPGILWIVSLPANKNELPNHDERARLPPSFRFVKVKSHEKNPSFVTSKKPSFGGIIRQRTKPLICGGKKPHNWRTNLDQLDRRIKIMIFLFRVILRWLFYGGKYSFKMIVMDINAHDVCHEQLNRLQDESEIRTHYHD